MLKQTKQAQAKPGSPLRQSFTVREKFVGSVMAFVALVFVGLISINTLGAAGFPFMVASMGASSVLLFALPYSPVSQPWPLVGGHLVSSTVGVTCVLFIPNPVLAAAAAVSLAMAAMHIARCLHPPGGAIALAAVLGGTKVAALGYTFVLFPVMVNTLLLLGATMLLNNVVPGRRYPARRGAQDEDNEPWTGLAYGLSNDDMRTAVNSLEEFVDITEEQLNRLYKATIMQMRKRELGDIRCGQIMARDVICFYENMPLSQAWLDLQTHGINAVPVVDTQKRLTGIITRADLAAVFMKKMSVDTPANIETELKHLYQTPIGAVMTTPVTTIGVEHHIVETIPLFMERKIHQLPVVNTNRVVLGLLTRTHLLTLLE